MISVKQQNKLALLHAQIDYFQFNNHKIVQHENKNLSYINIYSRYIMLRANIILEEHCHHTHNCTFSLSEKYYRTRKIVKELERINAIE